MCKRSAGNDEKGFTLVEVVVALTVIAIGIMGLSIVFPLATRDVGKSGVATRGLELCQEKLEDLHMLGYTSVYLEAGYAHADSLNPIDSVYVRTWEAFDDQPMTGCKRVEVTVSWPSYSEGSVTLWTVLASAGR